MPRHIRKGDEVMVRSGDFKGATGTVVRILTKHDRVVVKGPRIEGLTKTLKPTRINPQGGQVTVDRSFHLSNISPVVEGKAARVRFPVASDGSKTRVAVAPGGATRELGTVAGPRTAKARAPKKTKAAPSAPSPARASAKTTTKTTTKTAKTTKTKA